jgi:hypothetical protein
LFIFTLAVGTTTVAAISLSPLWARRVSLVKSSSRLGTALVASSITVGAASVTTSWRILSPKDALFLCLFVILLLGTVLILGDTDSQDDGGDGRGDGSDDDPPWWPEFESGFSQYVRRPRSPVVNR